MSIPCASGPQPHPSFIELFCSAPFSGADGEVARAGRIDSSQPRTEAATPLAAVPEASGASDTAPNCPATDEPFSDRYTTYCQQIGVVRQAANELRTNRRVDLKAAKAGRCAAYSSTLRTGEPRGGATRQRVKPCHDRESHAQSIRSTRFTRRRGRRDRFRTASWWWKAMISRHRGS
jgi:hypothetical protein